MDAATWMQPPAESPAEGTQSVCIMLTPLAGRHRSFEGGGQQQFPGPDHFDGGATD
jgi:hypothetical protein